MKLIITGSAGFIGSHLLQRTKSLGYKILGIDKKNGIDITDYKLLVKTVKTKMPNPDMIVHLAANCSTQKSLDHPAQDFADNAIGTFNACELAREIKAPILYASTCKAKPNKKGARTPYGLSKLIGEMYIQEYHKIYSIDYVINRFGTIYGPGQEGSPESGWISWFIKASTLDLPITIYGDGKQSRDILFIDDCISLLTDQVKNFKKYQGKIFDVGGGKKNEINLLRALKLLRHVRYNFAKERPGDVKRFVSNNKRVSEINGWQPKVSWQEGIKKTIEYAKINLKK